MKRYLKLLSIFVILMVATTTIAVVTANETKILQNTEEDDAQHHMHMRNIISDSGFEENPWVFYTDGMGTFSRDSPGANGGRSGHITIDGQGTNVQLYQDGMTLKPHTSYRLSFKAYSNSGHDVSVSLIKHKSPFTNYGLSEVVDLGTSWKGYSIDFTTPELANMDDGRLMFWLAPYAEKDDHYYFDDIMITKR